jgi:16S rRNA (cytosine1402-N4)-methyltransferase
MHTSVLYQVSLDYLRPFSGGRYIDGTLGAGGHAAGILKASHPEGQLLAFDRDADALALARSHLAEYGSRAILVHASYITMKEQVEKLQWDRVDGILLDLGLSSMQLDNRERGFSFRQAAPLDMRFDQKGPGQTAADLVNELPEDDLADLIYEFGEEHRSRRIARAIVAARPVNDTAELAAIVAKATGTGKRSRIHPATKTFQALRIEVNQELAAVDTILPIALELLTSGGRLAVISFHSLEDRRVKQLFRQESRDCICPPGQIICDCGHRASITRITRKPVVPSDDEIRVNSRARSAKLRVAEKL